MFVSTSGFSENLRAGVGMDAEGVRGGMTGLVLEVVHWRRASALDERSTGQPRQMR